MNGNKVECSRAFEEQLGSLLRDGQVSTVKLNIPKRGWVYHLGDRDQHFYWIESGLVKTVLYAETGKECVLSVHGRYGVFGELCFAQEERMEAAVAMQDTILWKISPETILHALSVPELRSGVVSHLTHRLLEQQQTIADLVMLNSEQRLASMILQLARKLGKRSEGDLHLDGRMSHEELSAMVGTTRSRVGYFLKRFREAGLVEINRKSTLIVHEDRLVHFASGEWSPSDSVRKSADRAPRQHSLEATGTK
jgi:CRP-like cAMP-binding protein